MNWRIGRAIEEGSKDCVSWSSENTRAVALELARRADIVALRGLVLRLALHGRLADCDFARGCLAGVEPHHVVT